MDIIEEKVLRYINEERGISNTVVQWSKIVIDVLQAKIKITKTLYIAKTLGFLNTVMYHYIVVLMYTEDRPRES